MSHPSISHQGLPSLPPADPVTAPALRYHRIGKFVLTGDELGALNEAFACHDAQLENIRAIDVERAADEVTRRIREGVNTTNVRAEMEREAA